MAGIVVKPRARILHGHDWVFSSEVLKVFGNPADGDVISLKDGKDHLIGSALYNSKSQIVARRFSRRRQDLDLDFFKRRITQAAEYRTRSGFRFWLDVMKTARQNHSKPSKFAWRKWCHTRSSANCLKITNHRAGGRTLRSAAQRSGYSHVRSLRSLCWCGDRELQVENTKSMCRNSLLVTAKCR